MTVEILDIGKADCVVLQYRDKVCLIDTGEEEDLAEIKSCLSRKKILQIDYLIISHFDKDHVGGAADIVENYTVKQVYTSAFEKDSDPVRRFLSAMDAKGILPTRLTQNTDIRIDDLTLSLSPPKKTSYTEKEDNNASLTVTAQLGEKRLMFCGDAMEERLSELLSEDVAGIDFMKMPYHGRRIENLEAFLDKTNPKYCAITCSEKNPPDEATINLLDQRGIKTYLTENGTVRVTVTPDSLSVNQ